MDTDPLDLPLAGHPATRTLGAAAGQAARAAARCKKKAEGAADDDDATDDAVRAAGDDSIEAAMKGSSLGMHDLAAAFVSRGDLKMAEGLYKHQLCMVDELPLLASHGLLVEITFPRRLLEELLPGAA